MRLAASLVFCSITMCGCYSAETIRALPAWVQFPIGSTPPPDAIECIAEQFERVNFLVTTRRSSAVIYLRHSGLFGGELEPMYTVDIVNSVATIRARDDLFFPDAAKAKVSQLLRPCM